MGFSLRRYLLAVLSRREAGVGQSDWKRLRFTYAQHGEDIIAEALLPEARGFYVEVGAFHPVQISNTYLFYRKGWRGIAIDPNPAVPELFHRTRPRDLVVECAVGEDEGVRILDMTKAGESHHLRGAGVASQASQQPVCSIRVDCRRLESILKDHLPAGQTIDFLSIDAEGHDLSVLRSNDWQKYRPRLIAVEDFASEVESPICKTLSEEDYKLVFTSHVTRFFMPLALLG